MMPICTQRKADEWEMSTISFVCFTLMFLILLKPGLHFEKKIASRGLVCRFLSKGVYVGFANRSGP
jgi:hypothetical protein